jgi:hypothetical protein
MMKRLINLMPFLASFIGVVCAASLGSAQDAGSGDVSPEQAMHQRVEKAGRRGWQTWSFLETTRTRARGSYQKRKR